MTVSMKIGAADGAQQLSRAIINSAAGGDITLVAAVAGAIVRLYKLVLTNTTANVLTFKDGAAAISGPMAIPAGGQLILPFDGEPWEQTSAGNALVLNSTGATQISGVAYFTQGPALSPV